ncbi:MAG TPA: hypothetical protein VG735_15275 [Caulobacterales bacterium]|nr:hypothetical protein [Caulobacterales bacterium]
MSIDYSFVFQALTGLGTLLIAWIAYEHSRRSFQFQSVNLYINGWRELSLFYVENERARAAFARMSNQSADQADDVTFLTFLYLNQALLAYYAGKFGAMPRHEVRAEMSDIWRVIGGQAERAKALVASTSYPPKFKAMFVDAGRDVLSARA